MNLAEYPQQEETAEQTVKMAGFNIGDQVKMPFLNEKERWRIAFCTTTDFHGRTVPAVTLRNQQGDIIVVNLYELCINNPQREIPMPQNADTSEIPKIGEHLTQGKIIFLTKKKTKIMFGQITNSPIETGKAIVSTLQRTTSVVESIIIKGNNYIIKTEDGEIYIFEPSQSINVIETD